MKERPILFSAPMVLAILEGRKTVTRRIIKKQPTEPPHECMYSPSFWARGYNNGCTCNPIPCPYAAKHLWVRETWNLEALGGGSYGDGSGFHEYEVRFRAGGDPVEHSYEGPHGQDPYVKYYDRQRGEWRPSIHMPRWASRLSLEVTGIRVERLQDITDDEACREGVDLTNTSIPGYATERFKRLWESINGAGTWDLNPWVWAVSFKAASK